MSHLLTSADFTVSLNECVHLVSGGLNCPAVSQRVSVSGLPEHEVIFVSGGAVVGFLWPSASTAPSCRLTQLMFLSPDKSARPSSVSGLLCFRIGRTGFKPAPPASSSTSSERQQHPHIAPRDNVKVSAAEPSALSLCWDLSAYVLYQEEEGGVKALQRPIKARSSPEVWQDTWWLVMSACLDVKNHLGEQREAVNNQSMLLTNQQIHSGSFKSLCNWCLTVKRQQGEAAVAQRHTGNSERTIHIVIMVLIQMI